MKPRFGTPVVNAALFGVALITAFPLLWMVSVAIWTISPNSDLRIIGEI